MPTHFSAATGAIKRLIAVVDETGSNRPQENEQAGFGVGAILFADTLISHVVEIAQRIADVVKKEDFKYKHVQGSGEARQLFLAMFNNREKPVRCYGFFTPGACVAKELHLTKEAGRTYAGAPPPDLERQKTEVLLRSFIYSMAPQIAAYASANGYFVDMCWDRRTDIAALKTCWEEIINEMEDGI